MRHILQPLVASLIVIMLTGAAASARAASFTVIDGKADEEISETTRLYIDGALVGSFRLDAATPQITLPITVAGAHGPHDYALCGEIVIRQAAGGREIHEVSGQGTLRDPAGHVFAALGARDFTVFYLADPTDPGAVTFQPGHSSLCQAPVS